MGEAQAGVGVSCTAAAAAAAVCSGESRRSRQASPFTRAQPCAAATRCPIHTPPRAHNAPLQRYRGWGGRGRNGEDGGMGMGESWDGRLEMIQETFSEWLSSYGEKDFFFSFFFLQRKEG